MNDQLGASLSAVVNKWNLPVALRACNMPHLAREQYMHQVSAEGIFRRQKRYADRICRNLEPYEMFDPAKTKSLRVTLNCIPCDAEHY